MSLDCLWFLCFVSLFLVRGNRESSSFLNFRHIQPEGLQESSRKWLQTFESYFRGMEGPCLKNLGQQLQSHATTPEYGHRYNRGRHICYRQLSVETSGLPDEGTVHEGTVTCGFNTVSHPTKSACLGRIRDLGSREKVDP